MMKPFSENTAGSRGKGCRLGGSTSYVLPVQEQTRGIENAPWDRTIIATTKYVRRKVWKEQHKTFNNGQME